MTAQIQAGAKLAIKKGNTAFKSLTVLGEKRIMTEFGSDNPEWHIAEANKQLNAAGFDDTPIYEFGPSQTIRFTNDEISISRGIK